MTFPGFTDEITNTIRVPDKFFRSLLPDIDNLDELKLTLYVFWRFDHMESAIHYLRFSDLLKDMQLVQSMGGGPRIAKRRLTEALHQATQRGSLLEAEIPPKRSPDKLICLNSPRGRAVVDAVRRGDWRMIESAPESQEPFTEQPNIFKMYEANIGPLTPMMADALRDAEKTYQANWIEEAFRIAVERNRRNWHYIEAILHRWQEGGRDDRKDQPDRRDAEKTSRKYSDWEN